MVTAADFDRLRELNFGVRTLRSPLDPDLLLREIGRYNPLDAAEVSQRVRETSGLEPALNRLLALYEEVLEESRCMRPDPDAERQALAAYLQTWASWTPWLRDRCSVLETEKHALEVRVQTLEREHRGLAAQVRDQEGELRWMRASPLWRLRGAVLRLPGLEAAWKALRRG